MVVTVGTNVLHELISDLKIKLSDFENLNSKEEKISFLNNEIIAKIIEGKILNVNYLIDRLNEDLASQEFNLPSYSKIYREVTNKLTDLNINSNNKYKVARDISDYTLDELLAYLDEYQESSLVFKGKEFFVINTDFLDNSTKFFKNIIEAPYRFLKYSVEKEDFEDRVKSGVSEIIDVLNKLDKDISSFKNKVLHDIHDFYNVQKQIIGKKCTELLPEEKKEEFKKQLKEVFLNPEQYYRKSFNGVKLYFSLEAIEIKKHILKNMYPNCISSKYDEMLAETGMNDKDVVGLSNLKLSILDSNTFLPADVDVAVKHYWHGEDIDSFLDKLYDNNFITFGYI